MPLRAAQCYEKAANATRTLSNRSRCIFASKAIQFFQKASIQESREFDLRIGELYGCVAKHTQNQQEKLAHNDLAGKYFIQGGNIPRAIQHYKEILDIMQNKKRFDRNADKTPHMMWKIADLLEKIENNEEAAHYYKLAGDRTSSSRFSRDGLHSLKSSNYGKAEGSYYKVNNIVKAAECSEDAAFATPDDEVFDRHQEFSAKAFNFNRAADLYLKADKLRNAAQCRESAAHYAFESEKTDEGVSFKAIYYIKAAKLFWQAKDFSDAGYCYERSATYRLPGEEMRDTGLSFLTYCWMQAYRAYSKAKEFKNAKKCLDKYHECRMHDSDTSISAQDSGCAPSTEECHTDTISQACEREDTEMGNNDVFHGEKRNSDASCNMEGSNTYDMLKNHFLRDKITFVDCASSHKTTQPTQDLYRYINKLLEEEQFVLLSKYCRDPNVLKYVQSRIHLYETIKESLKSYAYYLPVQNMKLVPKSSICNVHDISKATFRIIEKIKELSDYQFVNACRGVTLIEQYFNDYLRSMLDFASRSVGTANFHNIHNLLSLIVRSYDQWGDVVKDTTTIYMIKDIYAYLENMMANISGYDYVCETSAIEEHPVYHEKFLRLVSEIQETIERCRHFLGIAAVGV